MGGFVVKCVVTVYLEIESEPQVRLIELFGQLKDIEKFMHDHGAELVLDFSTGEFRRKCGIDHS